MRKLIATLAVTAAVLSVGYTDVGNNVTVDCSNYGFAIFELEGERVKVTADGVTVFDQRITPYVTWNQPWPSERRNHRLVIRVDRDRYVYTVRGCR